MELTEQYVHRVSTEGSPASAIEGNVSTFLLEMGRVGGGEERRDREIVWTVGGSPIGYHNAVVHLDAGPARTDALIETWTGELRDRRLPGSWHVTPSMRPDDIADRLLARGFADGGDEPAMAADLATARVDVAPPEGFTVARVRDEAGLDAYRRVLGNGFGEGPREGDWVAGVFGRIGLGDGVPWRHYVSRVEGEPVGTASVLRTGGVAGVFFVSTAPDVRRRGIGTATTRHAMIAARALGCTTAVLGASPMGEAVYRTLGFEEVFRYRILEWSPGPPAGEG